VKGILVTEIRLHNTKTRAKEVFKPLDPDNVRMYVCGPTVYDRAHLGNARPVVVFDVLFRLLRHVYGGDHVTYVRNFTDVDDKINARAAESGRSIGEITGQTSQWFLDDMAALGALEPTHMPRATQYIPQMVAMIEDLIAKDHAYEADGHVLFSVDSYKDYGALSGRSVDDMIAGSRVEVAPYKRNPMDFVLWKPSSDDLPGWESPWGRGRPGWHIECSAMSYELLGESFDIHGGGNDLMFPHHENEIAQSCCAHPGSEFANYWMHNEMLQVEGKKMSKSLGNFFTVHDQLDAYRAEPYNIPNVGPAVRLRFLETHYRNPINFQSRWFEQSAVVLGSASKALVNLNELDSDMIHTQLEGSKFLKSIADDLNTPLAINEIKSAIKRAMNPTAIENPSGSEIYDHGWLTAQENTQKDLKAMLQFMGFKLADLPQFDANLRNQKRREAISAGISESIEKLISARDTARSERNFERADILRDGIAAAGVLVKDTPDGPEWELMLNFDPTKLEALK